MINKNQLKSCSLTYSIKEKNIIEKISLEFSGGNLYGILGPNGSGKSTLLKTLSGIWKLTSGSLLWNEQSLLEQDRRSISRIIALVPQNPTIHFDFIVEELVAMGRYPHGKSYWSQSENYVLEALKTVDALNLRKRYVNQLSSGERQRIYIARALVTESPVMLLDEPTASLDIRHQQEIWHMLKNLAMNGKIIIVATHDFSAARHYCSQIAILNHGRCTAQGNFSTIMNPQTLEEIFGVTSSSIIF